MVTFRTKMDKIGKIYITKPLRDSGLTGELEIIPNSCAAVIFRAGTKLEDVLKSVEIIKATLELRIKLLKEASQ